MSDDLKQLHDELHSTVEAALTPVRERIDQETKQFGEITAETKQSLERVNQRLDDIEVRWEKAQQSRADHDGPSEARGAFIEYLRRGQVPAERKDLFVSDEQYGGFLVPEDFRQEIIKAVVNMSPVRGIMRVVNTMHDAVTIPKRTGRPTGYWVAETGSRTESTPSYGQERIPVHEAATFVDFSLQLMEDAAFNIESELTMDLAEEFARLEGYAFVKGTGVGQPEGFMTNSSVSSTNSGDADEIKDANGQFNGGITLMHALKPQYAANGTWVMNFGTLGKLRTLKDTNNQYIWQPGSIAGDYPASILGRPYVVAQDMPDEGANTYPIAFGDFSRAYVVVDRVQLSMQSDPYTQAGNGLVRLYARRRVGGQVVLPEAIRTLKCST